MQHVTMKTVLPVILGREPASSDIPIYDRFLYVRVAFLEVLGTFLFVLMSALALNPWVTGALLSGTIYLTDGTHLSPNVSISAYLTSRIRLAMTLTYVTSQLVGTTLAVLLHRFALDFGRVYILHASYPALFGWELLATFFFIMLVNAVALRLKSSDFALPEKSVKSVSVGPVVIGLTVTALQLTLGTMCSVWFNSARLLADAVILSGVPVRQVFVRLAGQVIGTVVASTAAFYTLH